MSDSMPLMPPYYTKLIYLIAQFLSYSWTPTKKKKKTKKAEDE